MVRKPSFYEIAANGGENFDVPNNVVGNGYISNFNCAMQFFNNYIDPHAENINIKIEKLCIYAGLILNHVKVCVTSITTPIGQPEDHQSVISIFCKLNTRGLDLTASDILKVGLILELPDNQAESVAENWEQVFCKYEPEEIDKFFSAVYPALTATYPDNYANAWKAYAEGLPTNKLAEILNNTIFPLANIGNRQYFHGRQYETIINELETLSFGEWKSIVYSVRLGNVPDQSLVKLKKMCFCFAILGYIDNSRKKAIRDVFWTVDNDNRDRRFKEICDLAINRLSAEDIYTLPAPRRNFVLKCIDRILNNGVGGVWDYTIAHLEHVLPQNSENWINSNGWTEDLVSRWKHKVGNLVYLNARLNQRVGNSAWNEKKNFISEKIRGGDININAYGLRFSFHGEVFDRLEWTPEFVQLRHNYIIYRVREWLAIDVAEFYLGGNN